MTAHGISDQDTMTPLERVVREALGPGHEYTVLSDGNSSPDKTAVRISGSLLHVDNDAVGVIVGPHGDEYEVSDSGDAWFLARFRYGAEPPPTTAERIAEQWGVSFDGETVYAQCSAQHLLATVYRVMLASHFVGALGGANYPTRTA